MDSTARRYAKYDPMDRSHIPGIPNPMPRVYWLSYLPMFKDEKKDDATLHLIKFLMYVCRLKVKFLEDFLMMIFMAALEDKERTWYEWLRLASICSLKGFHTIFFDNYKYNYPSLLLVQNCCVHFEVFFQYI